MGPSSALPNARAVASEILKLRFAQLIINEQVKKGAFRIPVHLALGHEAIAFAVVHAIGPHDALVLSHRNIHYNLALGATVRKILDEFRLEPTGLASGGLGSMNLSNSAAGVLYTSSVLGNNLPVAAGIAFADRLRHSDAVTVVVTGDGAMEEGAFYETLLMMRSLRCSALVIVENNGWSLATSITERRCAIDLAALAGGIGAPFQRLTGNVALLYLSQLQQLRQQALAEATPVVVEVDLKTLGDWRMVNTEYPNGKYINYHAGAAPKVDLAEWPLLIESEADPLHVLAQHFANPDIQKIARDVLERLKEEIA
jgi:TPP-dependent pyruvate/acetoin dehydrogenase alpha subunit